MKPVAYFHTLRVDLGQKLVGVSTHRDPTKVFGVRGVDYDQRFSVEIKPLWDVPPSQDTERLDFVLSQVGVLMHSVVNQSRKYQLWSEVDGFEYQSISGDRWHDTPRDAIDEAISIYSTRIKE